MYGIEIKEPVIAWIGWRAIHHPGSNWIETLHDRLDSEGIKENKEALIAWANEGAWKAMTDWADTVSGSSSEVFSSMEGNYELRASPKASYGHLYISLFETVPTNPNKKGK